MQQRLNGIVPIVFISAHGDMNTAVEVMKAGASYFLTKPVDAGVLFSATARALEQAGHLFAQREWRAEIEQRVGTLTPREREVMALVVKGRPNKRRPNKLAADELGAAEKTIKIHRARVMEKMKVRSLADLVRLCTTTGFDALDLPPLPSAHTQASGPRNG